MYLVSDLPIRHRHLGCWDKEADSMRHVRIS